MFGPGSAPGPRGCGVSGCVGIFGQEGRNQKQWSYVGEGKGGYEKVETLVWVGEGNGTYDKEAQERMRPQARGGGYRRLYMSIMIMLVLAGAACLLASLAAGPKQINRRRTEAAAPKQVARRQTTEGGKSPEQKQQQPEFVHLPRPPAEGEPDCSLAADTASQPQQMWCCAKKGRMCPKLDCDAGLADWERSWSDGKKIWCCEHTHRGCPTQTKSSLRSERGNPTPHSEPSEPEQAQAPAAPREVTYSCDGSADAWGHQHREWCCWHYSRGCPDTPTTPPSYNCFTRERWSASKVAWCCKHRHLGCPKGADKEKEEEEAG